MKKRLFSIFIVLFLLAGIFFPENAVSQSSYLLEDAGTEISGNYIEGEALITLLASDTAALEMDDVSVKKSWDIDNGCRILLLSSDKYTTAELISLLQDQDGILSAEPNYVFQKMSVSNDPYVEKQWYQEGSASVNAPSLWTKTSSKTPVVAVVDSGIYYTHEDLSSKMWVNPYKAKGLAGTYGYDFGDNDSNPMDNDGHGTHIAGIIAASINNNLGVAGVSPNAKLMAVKIFDSNDETSTSTIVDAFYYIYSAQTYGANIVAVNCSWGGTNISSSIQELMQKIGSSGAIFSFAAGNSGRELAEDSLPYGNQKDYAIAVGSSDYQGKVSSFSCYSKTLVDLFAPGESILSTVMEDTFLPTIYNDTKRKELTSYYDDAASNSNLDGYTSALCGTNGSVLSMNYGSSKVSYLNSADFLNGGGGSYQWDVTLSNTYVNYFLYDVTDLNLKPLSTYYISFMMGSKSSSGIEWSHDQFISKSGSSRFVTYNNRTYMKIVGLKRSNLGAEEQTFYMDEISISKANPDTTNFGKYDFYSGTSMAAPVISGAIALLSQAYPNDTAVQRKARLLKSVKSEASASGKCTTGGLLSLSHASDYKTPLPKSITITSSVKNLNVKKSIRLSAKVYPLDASPASVKWSVNLPAYAKITSAGKLTAYTKGAGRSIKVTAVSTANASVKSSISIKINPQKVTSVALKKKVLKLKAGKKKKLSAVISPTYANNKSITWNSSNKRYATVTNSGVVKALKAGKGKTVKITAKAKDGSRKRAICKIKITA